MYPLVHTNMPRAVCVRAVWAPLRRAFGTVPPRDKKFAALTDADVGYFRSLLPFHGGVVTDEHELEPFNVDWMKQYRGKSRLGLKPKTTEQARVST